MAPNLEMEGKSSTVTEVSATEPNSGSASQDPENMLINCVSNVGDNTFQVGALLDGKAKVQNGSEDVEVDIIGCTKSGDNELVEAECQSTTENSSSFGATLSGTENVSTLNEVEVESPFLGGNVLTSAFDVYNGALPLRKQKLTDHWRKFIHPIMWRCKWTELQIKELQSRALKYDRELAEYDLRKQVELEESTLGDFDSKSQPFYCQSRRNQIMKRKRRKRVEETTDLASYMSCHNLFSYHEYKKSIADGACMDIEFRNLDNKTVNGNDGFGVNEEWPFLKFRHVENSMGQMLSKIELVQSQVRELKTRIDKVVNENSGKFSSINSLSLFVPCDALTSSDGNAASPPKSGNEMPDRSLYIASKHLFDCTMGDLVMPGSEEATLPPDMIRSASQPGVGDSCEPVQQKDNGLLIHNQASDKELHNFERIISQLAEKPQLSTRKPDAVPPLKSPKANTPIKTFESHGQLSTSRSDVRNSRRKWGSRRSRSGRWKCRSSG